MNDASLTITFTQPVAADCPVPPKFRVALYLEGGLWSEAGWSRVPAVGEVFTNKALNYDYSAPEITFFMVQAVIADATGQYVTWHVFVTPYTFSPPERKRNMPQH